MNRPELIIARRDPLPEDCVICVLWWNIEKNRFFKVAFVDNCFHWEKLEEKMDE